MKKNLLIMMVKAIAITFFVIGLTACSGDESPNMLQKDKSDLPISFDLRTGNMSRAGIGLQTEHKDFQVWAYKDLNSTYVPLMEKYKVVYDGSNWYYDGVEGQKTQYFDKKANNTYFFACTPYNANNTLESLSELTMQTYTAGYKAEEAPLYGSKEISEGAYGSPVSIVFTRAHAIVGISFTESLSDYKVEVLDLGGEGSSLKGVQALPVCSEIDDSGVKKVYTHKNSSDIEAGYNYKGSPNVILNPFYDSNTLKEYTGLTKTSDNLIFDKPESIIDGNTPVASPTKYYAVPSPWQSTPSKTEDIEKNAEYNSSLYFHMSIKLINVNNNSERYFYNVKVLVPAEFTQWQANFSYTYIFDITDQFKGGSSEPVDDADKDYTIDEAPIVFKNVEIKEAGTVDKNFQVHEPEN